MNRRLQKMAGCCFGGCCITHMNWNLLLQRKDHLDLIFIFDTRGNKSLALI